MGQVQGYHPLCLLGRHDHPSQHLLLLALQQRIQVGHHASDDHGSVPVHRFAYLTNRKWVFHSQASTFKEYASEIASFFAARIGTALLDMAIMFIFAEQMHLNSMVIKILANVVVVIVNYVASKFWIFKSKDSE